MSGHVFISYRHGTDGAYVEKLAEHLRTAGIACWFDRELITGSRWTDMIEDRINTCSAFIVIMTPAAKMSEWVDLEIIQAKKTKRVILPLLLEGDGFFALANMQYEDVRGGVMPSKKFITSLATIAGASTPRSATAKTPPTNSAASALADREDDARRIGDAGRYAEAIDLLRDLVTDSIRLRGADHRETLRLRHVHAWYIAEGGAKAEAARLLAGIVADYTRVFGADHPDTIGVRNYEAWCTAKAGRFPDAVRLLPDIVAVSVRVLGADHPETLRARHSHAYAIGETGKTAEASRLLRDLLADCVRVLGADSSATVRVRDDLAAYTGRGR